MNCIVSDFVKPDKAISIGALYLIADHDYTRVTAKLIRDCLHSDNQKFMTRTQNHVRIFTRANWTTIWEGLDTGID